MKKVWDENEEDTISTGYFFPFTHAQERLLVDQRERRCLNGVVEGLAEFGLGGTISLSSYTFFTPLDQTAAMLATAEEAKRLNVPVIITFIATEIVEIQLHLADIVPIKFPRNNLQTNSGFPCQLLASNQAGEHNGSHWQSTRSRSRDQYRRA